MLFLLLMACEPAESTADTDTELPADTDTDTDTVDQVDTDTGTDTKTDAWSVSVGPIPSILASQMQGTTMHDGCPVGLEELVLLESVHWDLEGVIQKGQLVVSAAVADDLSQALEAMFRAGFAIHSMRPASAFGGNDNTSMAADNTSAFNCRAVTGGSGWSQHSYGDAIDINPIENPYISGSTILPPEGAEYTDRSDVRPGMVVEGDAVTAAFDAIGWGWGGRWSSLKDYQHFSNNGQ
jgi:hypothetical protein